jgi:hypothetical protein
VIPEALREIGRMVVDVLEQLLTGRRRLRLQRARSEMVARLRLNTAL